MKIVLIIASLIIATLLWACCMAAAASDERGEKIYQEYLEYKRREEKNNGREND